MSTRPQPERGAYGDGVGGGAGSIDRVEGGLKIRGLVVFLAVAAASLYPLAWPEGRDSFPMSSYPMFSTERPDATVQLVLAVGDGPDGSQVLPTEATGHRHLTQAVRALAASVEDGGDRPRRLCDEVASWAGEHRPSVTQVRIVTARYDAFAFLRDGQRTPVIVAQHAECATPR